MDQVQANQGLGLADVIHLRGCLELALKDARPLSKSFGRVVEYHRYDNTVVTAGRRWVLSRIKSDSPASEVIDSLATGTSINAPVTGDAALVSETARKAIGTFTTTGLDVNPPSWRAEVQFATDESNETANGLAEAGLFNSIGAGTMLSRVTYTRITKGTSNTLESWGRTIVRWLRELSLIVLNPVMGTRGKQGYMMVACAA